MDLNSNISNYTRNYKKCKDVKNQKNSDLMVVFYNGIR